MSRKRKVEATRLDEVDRTLYSTFCGAANSLSQLYTQAMNQQKISFQAGERHALEKLYQWIIRRHEEGSRISVADIVAQIQNEMDYAGDDTLVSQRSPFQQQHQSTMQLTNSSLQPASSFLGQPALGPPRTGHTDHARNSVFSNALSSPVRRSLQPFQLPQGGGFSANGGAPNGNAASRNHDGNHNGDTDPLSNSNDSSMDIHTDIPPHRFY